MNKRGLSGIVTTLLIIVVVFIAVGLVWVVIQNVINEGLDEVGLQGINNNIKVEQVVDNGDTLSVKVKRDKGDAQISKLKFVISEGGDSKTEVVEVSDFDALETKTLSVPYKGIVKSIQVIPVFVDSDGNEKDGSAGGKEFSDEEAIENVDGLVSWWKLDGDAKDSIGGNDGSLMNGVDCNMEGKVGKACDFDGVDDYVDAGNDNSFNLGNISIEAWVYWRDTSVLPAELEVILAKNDAYYIALDAEDKPQSKLYYGTAESSSLGIPLSVYTFPSNEWVHFFLSYDGTTTKYYINAGEMASNFHNDPLRVTSDNLMIGTLNAANYFFNGTIDEVRIYDRGLSAEEVKSIYDLTK